MGITAGSALNSVAASQKQTLATKIGRAHV